MENFAEWAESAHRDSEEILSAMLADSHERGAHLAEPVDDDESLEPSTSIRHMSPKIGRNDPCTCGSGKKFKRCCGRPGK